MNAPPIPLAFTKSSIMELRWLLFNRHLLYTAKNKSPKTFSHLKLLMEQTELLAAEIEVDDIASFLLRLNHIEVLGFQKAGRVVYGGNDTMREVTLFVGTARLLFETIKQSFITEVMCYTKMANKMLAEQAQQVGLTKND